MWISSRFYCEVRTVVIVSAKEAGRLACYYPDEALTKEITSAGLENRDEFSIDLEDGRKIVNHAKIEGTDWQFIFCSFRILFQGWV